MSFGILHYILSATDSKSLNFEADKTKYLTLHGVATPKSAGVLDVTKPLEGEIMLGAAGITATKDIGTATFTGFSGKGEYVKWLKDKLKLAKKETEVEGNCVDFVGEALKKAKDAGAIDGAELKIFTDYKDEK